MIYVFEDKKTQISDKVFIANSADVIGDVTLQEDCSVWFGAVLRGDTNGIEISKKYMKI